MGDGAITRAQLVDEVEVLVRRGDLDPTSVTVVLPASLDRDHARNLRRYAQVAPHELRFEFAKAILSLPEQYRRGLIAHEIGHVLAERHWKDGSEEAADRAAADFLGVEIEYDGKWPGKGLQYVRNPSGCGAGMRANPEIDAGDAEAAIAKYEEFHRYDPKKLVELDRLKIPRRVRKLGPAKYVLYRSGKVDPATLKKPRKAVDYIHEHDAGVIAYATDGHLDTDVPKSIVSVTAIAQLGKCLGFGLRDGTEAHGKAPLPDLACTPDGKCLLVIQGEKVIAMFWGGALGVFARGIDG